MPKAKPAERPSIGLPDPLQAAQEEARNAKEGAHKLSRAVDVLRGGLELIAIAEFDHERGVPVDAGLLRALAVKALEEYSAIAGQPWRRNPIITSRAGDRSDATTYSEG